MNLVGTSIGVYVIGDFTGTLSYTDYRNSLDSLRKNVWDENCLRVELREDIAYSDALWQEAKKKSK